MNKVVDTLIVGNNIVSFLATAQILKSGKKALNLRDNRINRGDSYFHFLSLIDVGFVQVWAKDLGLNTRVVSHDALTLSQFQVSFNGKKVTCSGKSAWNNLYELNRKFPELFEGIENLKDYQELTCQEFDNDYLNSTKRLGKTFCRYKTIHQVNLTCYKNEISKTLFMLFGIFKTNVKRSQNCRNLASLFHCIWHGTLKVHFSDVELIHLFLQILSPRYELSDEYFETVEDSIKSLGGESIDDRVQNFSFHSQKPWACEFSSFAGVVSPKKIAFFTGSLNKLNIVHNQDRVFGCINLKYISRDSLVSLNDEYYYESRFIGNELGPIQRKITYLNDECVVNFNVFREFDPCVKVDFVSSDTHKILKELKLIDSGFELSSSRIIDETLKVHNSSGVKGLGNLSLSFYEKGLSVTPKNTYYLGPLRSLSLGLTQVLLEAREFKTFT